MILFFSGLMLGVKSPEQIFVYYYMVWLNAEIPLTGYLQDSEISISFLFGDVGTSSIPHGDHKKHLVAVQG